MKSKKEEKTAKPENGIDEPQASAVPEKQADAGSEVNNLSAQAELLAKEKTELFEKLQRISADYINYQKRVPRQIADSVAYEKKNIIRSLLPCMDNLAHALENVQAGLENQTVESFIKGVQIVYNHILEVLKSHGVERIESVGNQFDPSIHEAVMQRTDIEKPDNIVLEQIQAAYTINGQTLRAGKVIVNKLLPAATCDEQPKQNENESGCESAGE